MGTRLFSKRSTGHSEPPASPAGALERTQAQLLELLRRKQGTAVSFAELQRAGIEFPASVVAELELAGAAVERRPVVVDGASSPGVRLKPEPRPEPQFAPLATEGPEPSLNVEQGRPARLPSGPRWLAPAALLAAIVVVAALAAGQLITGAGGGPGGGAGLRPHQTTLVRAHRPAPAPAPAGGATAVAAATPVSAALAVQLEARGHELLEGGSYAEAVPVLTRAVAATGEQLDRCLQPVSETCLTYAYALYDLGRAMQLGGDPASAVPVLQRRLQIDNQRATVAAELERASAAAAG